MSRPRSVLAVVLSLVLGALTLGGLPTAATAADGGPPIVVTGAATDIGVHFAITSVGPGYATLNGIIDDNQTPTTYHFEYWSDAMPPTSTPETPLPTGVRLHDASVVLDTLTPFTVLYSYRLVATNAAGTTSGGDLQVRATAPFPDPPPPLPTPPPLPQPGGTTKPTVKAIRACRLPKVTGHSLLFAVRTFRSHHCGTVKTTRSTREQRRMVVRTQSPAAGKRIVPTATVRLAYRH